MRKLIAVLLMLSSCFNGKQFAPDASAPDASAPDASAPDASAPDASAPLSEIITVSDFSQCSETTPCQITPTGQFLEIDSSSLYGSVHVGSEVLVLGERVQLYGKSVHVWTDVNRENTPPFNEPYVLDRLSLLSHSCSGCEPNSDVSVEFTLPVNVYGVLMFFTDLTGDATLKFTGSTGKFSLYTHDVDLSMVSMAESGEFTSPVSGGWVAFEAAPDATVTLTGTLQVAP